MSIITKLQNNNLFSYTEQEIAQFIINNIEKVPYLTIKELATSTYSSPTSITRLCKKIGVSNYSELKINLQKEISTLTQNETMMKIIDSENIFTTIGHMINAKTQANQAAFESIDFQFIEKMVQKIESAKYVDIYASGTSLYAAKYFMNSLMQLGINASAHSSTNQKYAQAVISDYRNISIIICNDGENEKYINILKKVKQKKSYCIVLTLDNSSTLARLADDYVIVQGMIKYQERFLSDILYTSNLHFILDAITIILYSKRKKEYEDRKQEIGVVAK